MIKKLIFAGIIIICLLFIVPVSADQYRIYNLTIVDSCGNDLYDVFVSSVDSRVEFKYMYAQPVDLCGAYGCLAKYYYPYYYFDTPRYSFVYQYYHPDTGFRSGIRLYIPEESFTQIGSVVYIHDGTYVYADDDCLEGTHFIGNFTLSGCGELSLDVSPTPVNITQTYNAQLSGSIDYADLIQVSYYCYKLKSDNSTIDNQYTVDYTIYSRTEPVTVGDSDWDMYRQYNNGDTISDVVESSDLYEAEFYPYESGFYYLTCTLGYDTDDDGVVDHTDSCNCYQRVLGVYFAGTPTSGTTPLTVSFTDLSEFVGETPTSWYWEFGDGYTSYVQNPSHTYTAVGNYDVTLTVYTGSSGYSGSEPEYITVSSAIPIANYTATPVSGNAPLTVTFNDTSEGATSWYWEFGDGYTSSAQNPAHTYVSEGDYTVILTAYSSSGSDTKTKTEYISVGPEIVTGAGIIYGYTHDGTDLIDGVTVTISNSTWSSTNTSYGGGYYKFSGLLPGSYEIKGSKSGYVDSPDYSVTAYEGTSIEQDVTLGVSGVAVTGTCYNAVTEAAIEGVTVTFTQSGLSYTDTSDSSGEYVINDLSSGSEVNVNAALSGYTFSSWSFTPEDEDVLEYDLYLIPSSVGSGTTIFGLVYDSDDEQAIEGATVTVTNGSWTETDTTLSTGFYIIDEIPAAGSYSVSAVSSGYDNSSTYSVTAVESSSVQQDIPLDSSVTSDLYSEYLPHLVRFLCVDEYNRPLQDVTVTAVYEQSSGPVDWIYSILGLSEDTGITSETLSGTTGIDGSIVFTMVETIKYDITVTASDLGLEKSFSIYPKEDEIVIRFYLKEDNNLSAMPDYDLYAININSSYVALCLTYNDTTKDTTSLNFLIRNFTSDELVYSEAFTNVSFPGTLNISYSLQNINGSMYIWGFEASHIKYGNLSAYDGLTMKGAKKRWVDFSLGDLGLSEEDQDNIYIWLSIIFIFGIAGIFSGLNIKQGAIFTPLIGGGTFLAIGWLPATHGILISTMGFIGVLIYMRKSEWKVKT